MIRKAALYAFPRAVRTFAQTASAALGGVVVVGVAGEDLRAIGLVAAAGLLSAVLASMIAFFQNLAEQLPE